MSDLSEFVVLSDTTLTTDSRRVAKHFKKRHEQVLRAFDSLECPPDFSQHNFVSAEEPDAQGKLRRVIRMTKDGFMLLAMGFTGKEAVSIKVDFIKAFNAMAEQLQLIGDARFHSLWAQRMELEKRDATSFAWASFGGKCMKKRRDEKPLLENERALLDSQMQPPLFASNVVHLTTNG